jgi:filamentous hemagglutinin family protein
VRGRGELFGRTALCGALLGLAVAGPALALPVLGGAPQVNAGGAPPVIASLPGETDVALHAPRTVIDWTTYNVGAGEKVAYTFDTRNWIVLNRINDSKVPEVDGTITGTVNGAFGGNIWFAAKNGMIFGNGAKVDAGGILVSAAAPEITSFLDPANTTFSFPGSELLDVPAVGMTTGSSITGHGGLVALIAPEVVTQAGTSVTGQNGSSVLYGAAVGYTLRLAQNAPGDFDLVDFIITNPSNSSVLMDLQNATSANSVFVAAVSSSSASSAVINLGGVVTATAATTDGGDIILSGGGGISGRQIGANAGGIPTDIYLTTATASRDLLLQTSGQVIGQPYQRPPPPPTTLGPPPVLPPPCNGNGCETLGGSPFGGLSGPLSGGPETLTGSRTDAADPSQVSVLTATRDIILKGSQAIALGTANAGRDFIADGAALQANSLTVARTTSLKSETGDIDVGALNLSGAGAINAAGSVLIDSASLSGGSAAPLSVAAVGNLGFGDGTGSASGGVITLSAGGSVAVNLASATIDSVTAGASASVQANTLTLNRVSGGQVLVSGGTINLGQATSRGDLYVAGTGNTTVGQASAGDDVFVLSSGGTASLTNATLTGQGTDTVGFDFVGNPDAANNGRVVSVTSTNGSAMLGLGTGAVTGATAVNVAAGLDAVVQLPTSAPGALTVSAGRDATLSAPTVTLNAVSAGRDVTLMTTVGDFTSTSPLVATRNLSIGAAGNLRVGDITARSGSIALSGASVTAGALAAGQDLTLQALHGGVQITSFSAGRDLILQGSTLSLGQQLAPIGRDLSITTPGDFTDNINVAAGRNVTLNVGGVLTVQTLSAPGAIDIVAGDINLGGTLSAATVQIESASGALRVGGSAADGAPASGLWLDNAEFGRIRATGAVSLYAGQANGTQRGDLTVLQLDISPAATPTVDFLAGGGHNALIQGAVAPTASGAVVQVGDPANAAWQPTQILLSGSLGAALYANGDYSNVRAFNHVRLFATQDIIMGSQRFIGLIEQAPLSGISIGKNQPTGVIATPSEQNHVLVAAGDLEVSSQREVVAQNTAATPDVSVGLFLTGASRPNLVIDPPQLVDVYGAFTDPSGQVVSSFAAGTGLAFSVVDSTGAPTSPPLGAIYRFNSCAVGTSQCSAAGGATGSLQQQTPFQPNGWGPPGGSDGVSSPLGGGDQFADDEGDQNGADAALASQNAASAGAASAAAQSDAAQSDAAQSAAAQRAAAPPLLAASPGDPDAALAEPVTTGAGSEEIWRGRAVAPQTPAAKAAPNGGAPSDTGKPGAKP